MPNHILTKCPTCEIKKPQRWYQEKILITSSVLVLFLLISYLVPFLQPLFKALIDYLKLIWWAVLLGVFIGGLIDQFVSQEFIVKFLAQPSKKPFFTQLFLDF